MAILLFVNPKPGPERDRGRWHRRHRHEPRPIPRRGLHRCPIHPAVELCDQKAHADCALPQSNEALLSPHLVTRTCGLPRLHSGLYHHIEGFARGSIWKRLVARLDPADGSSSKTR